MSGVSLNDLVGGGQQRFRDGEAEGLGGFEVDDQFELGRLFDRDIGRLRPPQNLVDKDSGAPVPVPEVWSIGHQTSSFELLTPAVHRRQSRPQRQSVDLKRVVHHQWVGSDIDCERRSFESLEGGRDFLRSPDFEPDHLEAERAGGGLNLLHYQHAGGIVDVDQYRQPAETGHKLVQECEALTAKIGLLDRHAGDVAARPRKTGNQSSADRVPIPYHHDRNDRCGLLCEAVDGVDAETMTSTLSWTNSAANSAPRSMCPSPQRYSIATLRPSVHPKRWSSC